MQCVLSHPIPWVSYSMDKPGESMMQRYTPPTGLKKTVRKVAFAPALKERTVDAYYQTGGPS